MGAAPVPCLVGQLCERWRSFQAQAGHRRWHRVGKCLPSGAGTVVAAGRTSQEIQAPSQMLSPPAGHGGNLATASPVWAAPGSFQQSPKHLWV